MSRIRSPFEENHQDDGMAVECFLCHGHISAGTDPPVCKECTFEFEIECSFNRMARRYNANKNHR